MLRIFKNLFTIPVGDATIEVARKKADIMRAYLDFWKNYVNFSGRTGRRDYWIATLWHIILLVGMYLLTLLGGTWKVVMDVALCVYYFAMLIPSISMEVRRLRDGGFHWAFFFIRYVPLLGSIASIILACQPSIEEPEKRIVDVPGESFYN